MEDNSSSSDDHGDFDFSRISLRPFDLTDIDDFMEWAADDQVNRFSNRTPYFTREVGLQELKNSIFFHPWNRSICLDNRSIGSISVSPQKGKNDMCRAEIGYSLGSSFWGKGIATHVVRLVATSVFWEWPHLERLEALVDVENVASQRVVEKVGFQKEGVLRKYFIVKGQARDMVMYSLLANEA
ncbi:hypothetical protein UlMin_009249 [Ulmus minor]